MSLIAALSPLSCGAALAQNAPAGAKGTVSVRLDPARTSIQFSAGGLRRIHGSFQLKSGLFALDTQTGVAQGEILVDAASEKSSDAKLDQKLRTETLESAKYPGIFFHPEQAGGKLPSKDGDQQLKLSGAFNIHGADHALTVTVDARRQGTDVFLKSTFSVPYVQWGMKDASTLWMHDRNVRITVESHGTMEAMQPPG